MVYVTTPDEPFARAIAESVVGQRLAACANILPGMQSIYWWNGAVESARESILILKTRQDLVDSLSDAIKSMHPYECPCIVALPIIGGNESFLEWILSETSPVQEPSRIPSE